MEKIFVKVSWGKKLILFDENTSIKPSKLYNHVTQNISSPKTTQTTFQITSHIIQNKNDLHLVKAFPLPKIALQPFRKVNPPGSNDAEHCQRCESRRNTLKMHVRAQRSRTPRERRLFQRFSDTFPRNFRRFST